MSTYEERMALIAAERAAKIARNQPLVDARMAAFNRRPGPRIGDYIRLPKIHSKLGQWTRFTHDWGDTIQTGGSEHGSYYLGSEWCEYSGGLDHGVNRVDLIETTETKPGRVWIFDEGRSGAGRGVDFMVDFRVFTLREGADLSGIGELKTGYYLHAVDAQRHTPDWIAARGLWFYEVTRHAQCDRRFLKREELDTWLAENGLQLTKPLEHGVESHQPLNYLPEK